MRSISVWPGRVASIGLVTLAVALSGALNTGRFSGDGPCGRCETTTLWGISEHDFPWCSGFFLNYQWAPNACHGNSQDGSCGLWHFGCDGAQQSTNDIRRHSDLVASVAAAGSADEIRALIDEYPGTLSYNTWRAAVQLWDCSKEHVVGHYPVPPAVAAELEEAN
jgi:hypothetical protein